MRTYLDTAVDIHSWLGSLQVQQRRIEFELQDGQMVSEMAHPVQGRIQVRHSGSAEEVFRLQGIAVEKLEAQSSRPKLGVYDFGGIWDPIDGGVPGEHYATTHFALLSAILFTQTKEPRYLQQASDALEFHLHTSKDEYRLSNWMYHWDFQNYAFVATFELLEKHLSPAIRSSWMAGLRAWRTNHRNRLANWAAMRMLAYAHRHRATGSRMDQLRSLWQRREVRRARQADGCFDDDRDRSRPIQYHLFTVALLHRIYLLNRSPRLRSWFMEGMNYALPWFDPDGDFNYWGRGQEQIFGYGAAIYALEAAAQLSEEPEKYRDAAARAYHWLLSFQRGNHFPLVLNARRDEEQYGWYDYHHTTVYNAFLGVWLAFAHQLTAERKTTTVAASAVAPARKLQPEARATFFAPTQIAMLADERFFCAIGAGLGHYYSEAGLTPCHLWMKGIGWVFSCPGGPAPDSFGKLRHHPGIEENFLAPLAILPEGRVLNPASGRGRIVSVRDLEVVVHWQNDFYSINRRLAISDRRLIIADAIQFNRTADFREFRWVNFPVVTDKFRCDVDRGRLLLATAKPQTASIEIETDTAATGFQSASRIKSPRGEAVAVGQHTLDYHAEAGTTRHVTMWISEGPLVGARHEKIAADLGVAGA